MINYQIYFIFFTYNFLHKSIVFYNIILTSQTLKGPMSGLINIYRIAQSGSVL